MKCPKCNVELSKGKTTKKPDGTEYTVFRCLRCKKKFTDIKIPNQLLFGDEPAS